MNTTDQRTTLAQGSNTWIAALGVLCFGIVGFGVFYSTNTISDPAFLAGQYLVYAFFLWAIFHAVFLRKRGTKISGITFVAIFIALFAGGLITASKQRQQAVQAVSSIQQELGRVASASTDSSGLPARIERTPSEIPKAKGEFGEMERFAKEFIDRFVALRNDYISELDAIGWNSILDAKRIKNDTALSGSKVMIERAKAIADKYEKKTTELIDGTRAHINALNMSESNKREMLAGFERGMSKSGKQIDEQWKLEKQVLLQFENIIVLLAARKNWVVRGERILFYSEDDLARFNSYIGTIQRLVQQQEQIQKASFAEANQKLNDLRNSARK
ncbi:MAG: hypothetical protein BWY57_01211 [Betaproteobacteria bacterium ADurb.Bin341]|nr:MAG: hypothetical protein BWY57_01211 [Betaproteobacteria bacterium ADurb.Bin341]